MTCSGEHPRALAKQAIKHLRQLIAASGVTLHLIDSARDGKLDAENLCQKAPVWS
ncbi:hypothetical protein AGMMS49545_14070 [Betaproteobacteria bacterium]|nr:hypothetical protein AGMMS49545_14070 [Betaproteobacteria bacterium]GHU45697.1 hypothetical protein AGMMS50289_17420 [Betaproteobacteria bacterium]